jgi:hypothetical protein
MCCGSCLTAIRGRVLTVRGPLTPGCWQMAKQLTSRPGALSSLLYAATILLIPGVPVVRHALLPILAREMVMALGVALDIAAAAGQSASEEATGRGGMRGVVRAGGWRGWQHLVVVGVGVSLGTLCFVGMIEAKQMFGCGRPRESSF